MTTRPAPEGIPEDRKRQFDRLEEARDRLAAWSKREGFPLHQVEVLVPFVPTDFRAHVLFFLQTDAQVRAESDRPRMPEAQEVFLGALRDVGYPEEHLRLVTFEVDSDERVNREFEGSYFARLR